MKRVLARRARRWVRAQVGDAVVPTEALADELSRWARRFWLGAAAVEDVAAGNLIAHGAGAVADAARAAMGELAPGARRRVAIGAARALAEQGGISAPLALLADVDGRAAARSRAALSADAGVLQGGVRTATGEVRAIAPTAGRVLYHASLTVPHHSNGYAIRTHWLARTLREQGWDMRVVTRFGYPNERYDFRGRAMVAPAAEVNGVPYLFTPSRSGGLGQLGVERYHQLAVDSLERHARALKPAVLHSASDHATGLAGAEVARRLGIPSIYEVRGLWHLTRASKLPAYLDSEHFRMVEALEAQAARASDHVFAITEGVAEVLAAHGVARARMTILPNSVDPARFSPRPRDRAVEERYRLGGKTVVGYLGSLRGFEGLDDLLDAAARLRAHAGDTFRVLLVGDGSAEAGLRARAADLGLGELVVFAGRAPHDRVHDFYSVMDVMAFPRRDLRVCHLVSPLKPFEAMAAGVAVVASDVRALAEIVVHEQTGLLCRAGDAHSLADALARAIADPALRAGLAERARAWVSQERTWSRAAADIGAVYRSLGASPSTAASGSE